MCDRLACRSAFCLLTLTTSTLTLTFSLSLALTRPGSLSLTCADFVAGAALGEPRADFVAGAALVVNLDAQISWQAAWQAQRFVNFDAQSS